VEEIFTSHQSTFVSQPSHNGFRPFYIDMAGLASPHGFPADPALGWVLLDKSLSNEPIRGGSGRGSRFY
jgi:hypothetical protein